MASPVVQSVAESNTTSAGTSHTVTLPSGITAGDLLIVILDKGSTSATVNALTGWTELLDEASANGLYIAYRLADGTEGSSITLTTSASTRSAQIVYRISGAVDPAIQAPQIGTTATGTSATPDPPSITPTGGAKDYLFIAFAGMAGEEADDDTWGNTPPTNYTPSPPRQIACGVAGSNLGGLILSAERAVNGSTENPGTFGVDVSAAWRAQTIAVHPVVPTQTSVARVSLGAANTPGGRRDHSIHIRGRVQSGSVGTFRAALYEGSTNRSGDLETGTLTTSLADYTLPISDANAANITDYSNLEIRFWGYVASGTTPTFEVAEVSLVLPDQISTELSPPGLDHSRAIGTGPKVNPSLGPASLTRTRALGGPTVSPKLGPAGLSRTRALGTITVTVATNLSPAGLDHSKALGSPTVSPSLGPAGLSHTRAIGSSQVNTAVELTGLDHSRTVDSPNVVLILKPLGLDRIRSIAPAPQVNTTIPITGLDHSRALGSPTVSTASSPVPGGLDHSRTLGSPQLNITIYIASAYGGGPYGGGPYGVGSGGLDHERTLGSPALESAAQITPAGLDHGRTLGSTTVSPRVLPASLTHTRAIGSPVLGLGPASLTHTRVLGSTQVNVTIYTAGLDHGRAIGQAGITGIAAGTEYDQDNHFRLPHYYS